MKKLVKFAAIILAVAGLAAGGYFGYRYWKARPGAPPTASTGPGGRKILYYVDPMHPAYKSDKPGIAPDCGMKLVPVYEDEVKAPAAAGGHEGHGMQPAAGEGMKQEGMKPEGMTDVAPIRLSPEKRQMIGVRTATVQYGPMEHTIRTVGQISYDETKIASVHTKFEGWIDKVYVDFVGKFVKKGDPLFSIYSPELVSTQQEYLLSLKAKNYLTGGPYPRVGERAESLFQASKKRLRLWDITESQIGELERTGEIKERLTFYSPIDGYVLERKAYENVFVKPDMKIYQIADLSTVWGNADIYEYEIPHVRLGQDAAMTLSFTPDKKYIGKVAYIYPNLENKTRTLKIRMDFPNPDLELKPGMYANVEIRVDLGKELWVPGEAVMDSGTRKIVFLDRGEGLFEPREVEVGAKLNDRYLIRKGLKPGERVVTSGNFLIDSESRLKAAISGMGAHQH